MSDCGASLKLHSCINPLLSNCATCCGPSSSRLPHNMAAWCAAHTHRHQLEKGYLALLLAGCLPGSKRDREWKHERQSLPTIQHLQACLSNFQIWPSDFPEVTFPLFGFLSDYFETTSLAEQTRNKHLPEELCLSWCKSKCDWWTHPGPPVFILIRRSGTGFNNYLVFMPVDIYRDG